MPLGVVVDASVLVKAYVPEVLSERAAEVLAKFEGGALHLIAPDLVYPESGNVLWKKHGKKELTLPEVKEIADAIAGLPLRIEPSRPFFPLAVELGIAHAITVYDALYLAVATVYDATLITADKKFVGAMGRTKFAKHILWLGDARL